MSHSQFFEFISVRMHPILPESSPLPNSKSGTFSKTPITCRLFLLSIKPTLFSISISYFENKNRFYTVCLKLLLLLYFIEHILLPREIMYARINYTCTKNVNSKLSNPGYSLTKVVAPAPIFRYLGVKQDVSDDVSIDSGISGML